MASRNIGGSIQAALKDLFNERDVVEDAIAKLQSLLGTMTTTGKRRGRPPGSGRKKVTAVVHAATRKAPGRAKKKAVGRPAKTGGKRAWSAATRNEASERMRKYWANRNKESVKKTDSPTKKRRGRPPASAAAAPAKKTGGGTVARKNWSPEARKAAADRMKKYWATRNKSQQG